MSEKDLIQEMTEKCDGTASDTGDDRGKGDEKSPVFYRCKCPECGEDDLGIFDLEPFIRTDFLGVTSEGVKGCGHIELDGEFRYDLMCGRCGHVVLGEPSQDSEALLNWARAEGERAEMLTFSCPVCSSKNLYQISPGVEISRKVVAVYMISEKSEFCPEAEIALERGRLITEPQPFRYRCSKGHELAKDDGTPVETPEDLVEWLKARSHR